MSKKALIDKLSTVISADLDQIKDLSHQAAEDYPEILQELHESSRRLELALKRELMDEYQIKLAFRVSVKKIIRRLNDEIEEG